MVYYLVGTMNDWTAGEAYKLSKNIAVTDIEEYLFNDLALETTDEFKVVYSEDGTAMTKWFPEGSDNNYGGNGEITAAGTYTVYFRPNYDGFVNVRDVTAIQRIVAEMSSAAEHIKIA